MSELLVLMLLGSACGAVGVWVVYFGQTILAESFGHALLAGLVLATLAGSGLFAGAIIGAVLAYALILFAVRTPSVSSPTGISAAVTTLVAIAGLLSTRPEVHEQLEAMLFGDAAGASTADLVFAAVFALVIGVVLVSCGRQFAALAFDSDAARGLGVSTGVVSAVAIALLAVTVSAAANLAGSLLALALVTGPALGATALARRLGRALLLAALSGALGGALGLLIAQLTGWPTAACVAIVLCGWALAGNLIATRHASARLA